MRGALIQEVLRLSLVSSGVFEQIWVAAPVTLSWSLQAANMHALLRLCCILLLSDWTPPWGHKAVQRQYNGIGVLWHGHFSLMCIFDFQIFLGLSYVASIQCNAWCPPKIPRGCILFSRVVRRRTYWNTSYGSSWVRWFDRRNANTSSLIVLELLKQFSSWSKACIYISDVSSTYSLTNSRRKACCIHSWSCVSFSVAKLL